MEGFYSTDKNDPRVSFKDARGNRYTTKYRCSECGCTFFGEWHSNYSMHTVRCPVCRDESDSSFIEMVDGAVKLN